MEDCIMIGVMSGVIHLDGLDFTSRLVAIEHLLKCGFTEEESYEYLRKLPLEKPQNQKSSKLIQRRR